MQPHLWLTKVKLIHTTSDMQAAAVCLFNLDFNSHLQHLVDAFIQNKLQLQWNTYLTFYYRLAVVSNCQKFSKKEKNGRWTS